MKRILLFWITVLLAATLVDAQVKAPATKPVPAAAAAVDAATYIIGPQDVLQVTVWKEPEMSAPAVPVRPDGKISLPLIDDVQAADLTPMKLANVIAEKLKKFVQDPQVSVIVTGVNSKRVYILGEVQHPGPLMMLPEMTVLQALSSAGGLSQFANAKKIYVLRTENGAQQKFPFNYKQALKGENPQQNFVMKPGDTIVVP
jgi:polysaccharide export outer membrane protein